MPLPNVADALQSFQQAFDAGQIHLQPGTLDGTIFVHLDRPNGELRLTYVRMECRTVTAMVQFIRCDPVVIFRHIGASRFPA